MRRAGSFRNGIAAQTLGFSSLTRISTIRESHESEFANAMRPAIDSAIA
jgi:hypothetical protein